MITGSLCGTTLADRFELKELLGAGATGEVYLAEHETIGMQYAVKVLREHLADDEQAVARFKREAFAASRLDHPNAVQIYDFGRTDEGLSYLVMEYVSGPTLAEIIAEAAPKPIKRRRALRLLVQVARALGAAHKAQIVHRDLNPSNVRVVTHRGDSERLKILDFGLAKVLADADSPHTTTGELFGTPRYMSPEQARGEPVDHRTDIYALGVLAFELCTGRPPFTQEQTEPLLQAHQSEPPPKPSTLLPIDIPPLPPKLEGVILKCLAKDREQRPAAVDEVLQTLEELLEAEPQPRAVPTDVAKVLETDKPGSSWRTSGPTWNPGDFAPTIPMTGNTLESPAMHPGDPAYRVWYWGQALKLAVSIAERLLVDELAPETLARRLAKLREAEDRTVGAETDAALVEAQLDDLEQDLQKQAYTLKSDIVSKSMALDSLVDEMREGDAAREELHEQLHDLEVRLARLRQDAQQQQAALEERLADRRRILDVLRRTQMEREVALLNELDEARPDPCPFFYERTYSKVAEMLQALKISDSVDLPG